MQACLILLVVGRLKALFIKNIQVHFMVVPNIWRSLGAAALGKQTLLALTLHVPTQFTATLTQFSLLH